MTPSDVFREAPLLSEDDQYLVELYERCGRTLDDLPYTSEYDELYAAFSKRFPGRSKRDVIERLFRLRKAARLPRLGTLEAGGPSIHSGDIGLLESLIIKYAGSIGQRDRLPATDEFDNLVREFNSSCVCGPLDPHAVWRLVARVAK